ncbi:MAG: D-2-hydroxyacid dehydrogenase, partial [Atopobiaceae bacterium]|nr:D-2-hydroxyacid dehydrogenase [Atopobiaceae bacterium]
VNVGRGNFIDCEALARVLADGHLRGAALDVTDPEPLPKDHPLWREPRCVITPHESGGAFNKCDATEDRICEVCCENLKRYLSGAPLTHVVL